ncbi:Ras-related protein RABC2a [Sesamum angolense]|uniref:Ras-related protein RABC2a n=1 Tax=Sesamum angolense TaxID=2727404 RepID=A0AAE2BHE3_9LAMI|nr:Ras-related protein RABC2a [Sesamum angolense]
MTEFMGSRKIGCSSNYDYSFKVLLIGDSGVGKSSLLLSFISNCQQFPQDISPTIGVDFKIKLLTTAGKRLKLTIWDTGASKLFEVMVWNVWRSGMCRARDVLFMLIWAGKVRNINKFILQSTWNHPSLSKTWTKELELYCNNPDCIKILVGNKVDRESERAVTTEEGLALAQEHKCLFLECSAKTQANVNQCFKELTKKFHVEATCCYMEDNRMLEVPSLLEKGSTPVKNQILKQKQVCQARHKDSCCS